MPPARRKPQIARPAIGSKDRNERIEFYFEYRYYDKFDRDTNAASETSAKSQNPLAGREVSGRW
jgi:hypothetical protein